MCLFRKAPAYPGVASEAHEHHSFTLLRHAEISGIEDLYDDAIVEPAFRTGGMMLFEPRQMVYPRFFADPSDFWVM
jgi:hypothetical protein